MTAAINRYKADLRELQFVLLEQFNLADVVGRAPFTAAGFGVDEAKVVLQEAYRLAREVLGPLNAVGDREGCKVVDGAVQTPAAFKDAWNKLYESGFKSVSVDPAHGGQGAPQMLYVVIEELLSGANIAFNMYAGLAWGAAEVIATCGTESQVHTFTEKMLNGTWGGTMCLTEPQAGSDVGAATTRAIKQPDGRYKISGTKIYISGGDHDLAANIIHLVLARVEGAPVGTKGLSMFIVPKRQLDADGTSGASNDVALASIEHKMGINGSATCVLNFGESGNCIGELVGTAENAGMGQMFKMMNGARIAVGLQGLALASTAYLNALEYAKDRKQGAHFTQFKDPKAPRVAIIEHPDVRRMLMDMKAHVEGIRALVVKLAMHRDLAIAFQGKDDEKAAYHGGQVDLLTPLVKAFGSDEAYRLCSEAIQVYGGAGFLKDWPVEQYARDAKILSIYEGTNHIQAMDLVARKLGQHGGANFQAFMGDVAAFVEKHRGSKSFGRELEALSGACEALMQLAMAMMGWAQAGKVNLVPLNANRFLKMMSQLACGYLLLDAALIAEAALPKASATDKSFYEGKLHSAHWFGRNVIPQVENGAKVALFEDTTATDIPDAAFATS